MREEIFVFEDANCPGMVYKGTKEDWLWLLDEGGCPSLIHHDRILDNGDVDCGPEGISIPIFFPSKR